MGYTAFYASPLIPGGIFLGVVLLLLIVPVFAVAALLALLLVAVALLLALVAAILGAPLLIVPSLRRHWTAPWRLVARALRSRRRSPRDVASTTSVAPPGGRRPA